jgi:hypothetical protein
MTQSSLYHLLAQLLLSLLLLLAHHVIPQDTSLPSGKQAPQPANTLNLK